MNEFSRVAGYEIDIRSPFFQLRSNEQSKNGDSFIYTTTRESAT